jgi:hypothetical protein
MEDMKIFGIYGINISALAISISEINPYIQTLVLLSTLAFTVIQIIKALKADFSLSLANIVMIGTMLISIVGSYYTLNNKIAILEIEVEEAKTLPPQKIKDIKQNFKRK